MTLYLVGTPIGNLEDMTMRAVRILGQVRLIAAEDTRTTGRLLHHFQIETPLISFHEYSTPQRLRQLVEQLTAGDVALVTDAGMPGLSDPGYALVRAAIEAGVTVSPIPGPAAAIAALVSSGLPTDQFLFLGFLPRRNQARRLALANVAALPYTMIVYEAPHRLLELLADMLLEWGDRPAVICRELTKLYEEIWRGPLSGAMTHFGQDKIRGEVTLVVAGAPAGNPQNWDEAALLSALKEQMALGHSRKEAAAHLSALSGWPKRELYRLTLDNS